MVRARTRLKLMKLPQVRPGGRFYLVTKNAPTVGQLVAAAFKNVEMVLQRGYAVFRAIAS